MTVHGNDAVGVLVNDHAMRIHAESPNIVFKRFCAVNDLAFVKRIRNVVKNRGGKFNTQLYRRIEQCSDVLVVMSRDSLNLRENQEDDWFRLEIAHALKHKKNIVPVFLRDFKFPVLAEHSIIARYLSRIGACNGAVEAFEELWREYAGAAD